MEREFKLIFPSEINEDNAFEYVFSNAFVKSMISGEIKELKMYSKYYDFDDRRLRKNRITLRLRKENDIFVTTVKYGGGTKNGLHERDEENILSESDALNLNLLKRVPVFEKFDTLLDDWDDLRERFGAEFTRNAVLLHETNSDTKIELALDIGCLFNFESENDNRERICELELELLSGNDSVFESIGKKIIEELKMQPFDKSKASRAAALK